MGKGRKVWSIIFMASGAAFFFASFTDIKDSWPVTVLGLVLAGIGVWMWFVGKKNAAIAEQKKQEEMARLAAIEKDIEERTRSFWFTVDNPNQEQIEKIYEKQYIKQNYANPRWEIVPYADDEHDEYGFNVMVEDKKVGEVPRDKCPQVIEALNNGQNQELYFLSTREMAKEGYVYALTVTVKYLAK